MFLSPRCCESFSQYNDLRSHFDDNDCANQHHLPTPTSTARSGTATTSTSTPVTATVINPPTTATNDFGTVASSVLIK